MDNPDGGFTETFDLRRIDRHNDEVVFELLDADGLPFSNAEITVPMGNWKKMDQPTRLQVTVAPPPTA